MSMASTELLCDSVLQQPRCAVPRLVMDNSICSPHGGGQEVEHLPTKETGIYYFCHVFKT